MWALDWANDPWLWAGWAVVILPALAALVAIAIIVAMTGKLGTRE